MRLIISGLFKEVWPRLSNMATLTLESVIHGHHIYKSRWTPLLGETLNTSLELDNEHDKYSVSIVKSGEIVGHVTRSHALNKHTFAAAKFIRLINNDALLHQVRLKTGVYSNYNDVTLKKRYFLYLYYTYYIPISFFGVSSNLIPSVNPGGTINKSGEESYVIILSCDMHYLFQNPLLHFH